MRAWMTQNAVGKTVVPHIGPFQQPQASDLAGGEHLVYLQRSLWFALLSAQAQLLEMSSKVNNT